MIEQCQTHPAIDDQNPWPGLSPFDEAAEDFFSGRDAESLEVVRLIGLAPLTVLYGKSGLGKTSLLLAGAFPKLRQQNILPIHLRLDMRDKSAPLVAQVVTALRAEIGRYCCDDTPVPSGHQSLWEYLHSPVQWWSKKNQPLTPLFVFDQFEEAFTLGAENPEGIEKLRIDLADLIENRIPLELGLQIEEGARGEQLDLRGQRYKVLLSLREDFLPEVEGWKENLPSLMRNRLRLNAMTADHALQVVSGITPAGRTHTLVSEETAAEIVCFVAAVQTGEGKGSTSGIGKAQGLRTGAEMPWAKLEIEPALLSLVCAGLNDKRKSRGLATIEKDLLRETGSSIIDDFYQRGIAGVPEKTQHFINNYLITEGGFRNSYPLQDAYQQGFLTEPLLRQLVNCRLLRIEHQRGIDRIELIHDRLTDVVRAHRDREQELAEEAARSRKRRQRVLIVGWFLFALAVFGAVTLYFYLDARKELRRAVAGKLVLQSRAVFEGNKAGNPEIALLLSAAAFQLHPDGDAYGGVQYALHALPRPCMKIITFPDDVLALSQDGRVVATGLEQYLRLWDLATGMPLGARLQGHRGKVVSVAFSPDGRTLASGSTDATVRLWDVATGKPRGTPLQGHIGYITSVAFSPDGRTLASASSDTAVRLWNAATGKPLGAPLLGHSKMVTSVAFSPDGRTLASGSYDNTVRLWDVATGMPQAAPLQGHAAPVTSVGFSPDGRTLASGSWDHTVRLWDVATWNLRGALQGHGDAVTSLAFTPDGRTLASGSSDKSVRLWDVTTGNTRGAPLQGHSAPLTNVGFSRDGRTLISWGMNTVRQWDVVANDEPLGALLLGHYSAVNSLAFSPDGRTLASGSSDRTVRLWDVSTAKPRGEPLLGHAAAVESLRFSPDGRTLASVSLDKTVRVWEVSSGKPERAFLEKKGVPGPQNFPVSEVPCVAISPDGRTLASGSYKTVQLWDIVAGKPRGAPLQGHTSVVATVAFSPDGRTLASASWDKTLRLWDVASGKPRGTPLQGHTQSVTSVAFSPDGRTLASGSLDGTVRLWHVATGKLRALQVVLSGVKRLAFSPDGRSLASVHMDGTVQLWDVATGEPLGGPLQTDRGQDPLHITSVTFSPDSRTLACGSDFGAIRLWDAPASWQDLVCGKVVHNLSHPLWKQYVPEIPYVKQCPNLPVPPD